MYWKRCDWSHIRLVSFVQRLGSVGGHPAKCPQNFGHNFTVFQRIGKLLFSINIYSSSRVERCTVVAHPIDYKRSMVRSIAGLWMEVQLCLSRHNSITTQSISAQIPSFFLLFSSTRPRRSFRALGRVVKSNGSLVHWVKTGLCLTVLPRWVLVAMGMGTRCQATSTHPVSPGCKDYQGLNYTPVAH